MSESETAGRAVHSTFKEHLDAPNKLCYKTNAVLKMLQKERSLRK